MNYLVDTNMLGELAKPQLVGEVIMWFRQNEPHLYVSSISIGELRKGLVVVTRNVADFQYAGVKLLNPFAQ